MQRWTIFGMMIAMAIALAVPGYAQTGEGPRLPPAPQPAPGAPGAPFGPVAPFGPIATDNFLVTSAANQHGSYLWIVASSQHIIILCEKVDGTKDFTCTSKRMP
jgi:hypothetical protein